MENQRFLELSATFFYLGRSPVMKGTVGTLGAIPLVFVFNLWGVYVYGLLTFLFIVAAWMIAEAYEVQTQNHDSPEVVIDEVAGFLVAMIWMPQTWQAFLGAFLLFRFLDILKPPPIGWLDQTIRGGYGAVIDDVVAGIITNFTLQIVYNYTDWLGVQWLGSVTGLGS
jgi:phosphatidylglycerophosphatase A